jgi:hypothetical protein
MPEGSGVKKGQILAVPQEDTTESKPQGPETGE